MLYACCLDSGFLAQVKSPTIKLVLAYNPEMYMAYKQLRNNRKSSLREQASSLRLAAGRPAVEPGASAQPEPARVPAPDVKATAAAAKAADNERLDRVAATKKAADEERLAAEAEAARIAARKGSVTRGSITMPQLDKIDHGQFSSEKERIASLVNPEESAVRAASLKFSFDFGSAAAEGAAASAESTTDPAPAPAPAPAPPTVPVAAVGPPRQQSEHLYDTVDAPVSVVTPAEDDYTLPSLTQPAATKRGNQGLDGASRENRLSVDSKTDSGVICCGSISAMIRAREQGGGPPATDIGSAKSKPGTGTPVSPVRCARKSLPRPMCCFGCSSLSIPALKLCCACLQCRPSRRPLPKKTSPTMPLSSNSRRNRALGLG